MTQLSRWLPKGGKLPEEVWQRRHRTIVFLLWVHVPAIFVFGIARGYGVAHVATEAAAVALLAALATGLPARRQIRVAAATIGLITCSAILVHLSGGLVEMHFHFFIMIGVLTMYEDWFPFLLSIAYVVVHHGFLGAVDPSSVYNHGAAVRHPWIWGAIHGGFVLGASVISVIAWRRNEEARARVDESFAQVAKSEAALQEAQELAHVGSWSLNLATMELTCSTELRRLYGTDDTVTWATLTDTVYPLDRALIVDCLRSAVSDGTPFDVEHRILTSDDEVKWLHSRGSAVRDDSRTMIGLHGIAQDITERKLIDGIVAESHRREQAAAEVLRAADEMKNDFLRALSHDLRTPLTVVTAAAELLASRYEELAPDQAKHMLGRLVVQARRLHALFTDLLDLERLTSGSYEPRRETLHLATLVRAVIDDKSPQCTVDVTGDVVATVDRVQVERILDNLIGNAIKHTPDGTTVHVSLEANADGSLITVADEGNGVADNLKEVIFEPFRRGASTAAGTGVGLSLVAKFAEIHGGRAWVEDRPGGGASFKVQLPNATRDATIAAATQRTD